MVEDKQEKQKEQEECNDDVDEVEQENLHRTSIIDNIKFEHLIEFVMKEGYEGIKDRKKITEFILTLDPVNFQVLEEEYADAQDSTNYILVLDNVLNEKFQTNYTEIMDRLPVAPIKQKRSLFLENYRYNESNNELHLRIKSISIKNYAQQWDFKKNRTRFFEVDDILSIPVRFIFDKHILLVRARNVNTVNQVKVLIFGENRGKAKPIIFEKEDKIKIYDHMTIIRNAHIIFPKEDQMNASFSAGINERTGNLGNLKERGRFVKALEEGILQNFLFSIPLEAVEDLSQLTEDDKVITGGINFNESKIYFRTYLTDSQTKYWILDILSQLDLSKYIAVKTDVEEFGDSS